METNKGITEQRVIFTSFFVDLLDVGLNLIIALLTGSAVLLSEFFQGLADLTAAGFLLVGQKLSKKKPDKLYPFGHGKEIYFWTLISAIVLMTLTATGSFLVGLNRFLHPEPIQHIWFGFGALLIAITTNGYALSLSLRRLLRGRKKRHLPQIFLNSGAVAVKNAFVLDLMGSSAAVFGLISLIAYQVTGETRLDGLGAMVIGVTTAILAFILIIGVKGFLVGKRASPQIAGKIKKAALTIPEVKKILDLRTMQIGSDKLLVNMEVHMKDRLTTDELEKLIDKIKSRVRKKVPSIQHVQVELETPD